MATGFTVPVVLVVVVSVEEDPVAGFISPQLRGGPGTTVVFASRTTREAILFRSLLSRLLVPLARTIGARTRHRRRFACFRGRLLTEEE